MSWSPGESSDRISSRPSVVCSAPRPFGISDVERKGVRAQPIGLAADSKLAAPLGIPPPVPPPTTFVETLERVWWRLDRALDADAIEISARIGTLDAVRCGTTTLIDHHASPNCIASSLDRIENGARDVGGLGAVRGARGGAAAGSGEPGAGGLGGGRGEGRVPAPARGAAGDVAGGR